ncbi:YqaE/Pmp3 family membrane protein [Hydrogenophaga sp.]|uniref:YqaE/Pmp3 family membrane protein n=1 Tax=Hydrogenophaga sp. TaxID=1904254 RepID=UPI002730AD63|nr:YqaE/Pmp3 family membrane protein [Hydrogenophaga sp.]MDP1684223.1 YqaE/Pmp3 family membrane protein [Hydrogenophaga sp.]
MKLLVAMVFPWIVFLAIKRPLACLLCLLMQLTLIGWIPAVIWSVCALGQYRADLKIERVLYARR